MNLKQFVIQTLRRASYRWPPRSEALKKARIARNQYQCAHCSGTFKRKEVCLDHINPVIDPEKGFTNWDDYINRMFCEENGFQVICIQDHDKKTEAEKEIRNRNKKKSIIKKRVKKHVD